MIVAAFVFGWVPSACERESRLLAIAEVGLRRLRRLHVRARGGPPPLAYSLAPLESQPAVLAWAVAQGRGAADGVPRRRCRRWLGTQRRPGERGGHGDALAPSEENFSIGTAFQKGGGCGYVETATYKCSDCFATYPYPPPGGTLSTFDSVLGLRRGRRAGRSVLVAAWAARARSGAAPAAATEAPFRDVPARTLIDGFPFDL